MERPANKIFIGILCLLFLEVFICQYFDISQFPFTRYPMYSFRVDNQMQISVLCSSELKYGVVPFQALQPTYARHLAKAYSRWEKNGRVDKQTELFLAVQKNLKARVLEVSAKSFYFHTFEVDKKHYLEYLKQTPAGQNFKKVYLCPQRLKSENERAYAKN